MSEMDISDNSNDYSNDSLLLDRVFLRLGNADSDDQLENCLNKFLPPVILKLSSPHEQIRTKVMELLVHVNKRVKCRSDVQLPVDTLLQLYKDPAANSFIINFTIIYITMGFPRLPRDRQLALAPSLLEAIENKPQGHQDGILMLVMPLLREIKGDSLSLKAKPKLSAMILKFATDVLLLPYRALPSSGDSDFQVPPGMSLKSYKRIVDKNQINANQLEEIKLSIVNFISNDIFTAGDTLLPLVVAAADSRFSVANHANSPLIRVNSSVDWSQPAVVSPLYALYLGTWGGMKVQPDDRKVPACTRLRLKLIQYLNKATGPAIMFPHCVQVVFSSLFDPNTNSRLRNMSLMFLLNVINNGVEASLRKVAAVFLQGLLKVIRSEEHAEHQPKAYMCLGRLAMKCPESFKGQFALLEELVKKIPEAVPEMRTALRDALLEMAVAYKISASTDNAISESGSSQAMEVDESSECKKMKTSPFDEPQALALFALLDHYMHSEESMIRYVATRYAAAVFPPGYVPARYLLLLASGDSQDDISSEALKCLYGTSRPNEIEDAVNNVSPKETTTIIEDDNNKRDKDEKDTLTVPQFKEMINYIWEQMQKRKKGSNAKHRFVISNQVLQFHPQTYQEMLRYLRMCLNRDANLKDCSDHPNATSPLLAKYLRESLLETEALDRYMTMITTLLSASPGVMPLTCFLDIIGCVPDKMAAKYTSLLPFLRNLFTTSTKEDIRDIAATVYAILTVHTSDKNSIDREITEFVVQGRSNKNLESQCGYISAFAHLCERCIVLAKQGKFGKFEANDWQPYRDGVLCLANFLSNSQTLLVNTSCSAISLLVRCHALPLPDVSSKQKSLLDQENPFDINKQENLEDEITKFGVADKLFRIVSNAKLPSKLKERALYTLGLMCCGERLSFAKQIVKGFLQMAKNSKEFEIHLQIGESLVLCVEGVNSNENRDLWTELPLEDKAKVKDAEALKENDELLQWLLEQLLQIGKHPHPHSRQATSIWLLALLKNCPEREPIKKSLQLLQDTFMDYLSENSDIVQDVASKGLSLVYQNSAASSKQALVDQIIEQLTSGKRSVAKVTEDTKIFEEGQLGTAPTGGNLSTYKELCSLASDLNQPDLLYKFMHLAHHNSVWNSKRGAAFGFQSIASQAGASLTAQLPAIVPRLYRYRFDPTPRIHNSMTAIWHALVPNTQQTVHKYHKEILNDLVANLTANQWRVRMSCCNALADLLKGAKSLHDSLPQLATMWAELFRVMDDVHEGTRLAATNTAHVLAKLCVQACDTNSGKDGKEIIEAIMPVLLDNGITNVVKEVRSVSLWTVSRIVSVGGAARAAARLVPALLGAAGELEPARLARLSTALAPSADVRAAVDDLRAGVVKHHHTTDTVVKCMPYIDIEAMKEMLPTILDLIKSPQLGTKVACAHFLVLAAHYLKTDLVSIAGRILPVLLNSVFDRNATVRKNYAEALGQITAYAKPLTATKLMDKLRTLYETKEDDASRSAIALTLKAVAKAKIEIIKDNEAILAPVVFLAMHAPKDDEAEAATVEMFEELWTDISPARETGVQQHLTAIQQYIETALASNSWTKKIQAANAVRTVCSAGAGTARDGLARACLAAAHGRTYDGKRHVLAALAALCTVKPGETPISPALGEDIVNCLLTEARKGDPQYRQHAVAALGDTLAALNLDRFDRVYDIVKDILSKDENDKDSDEEDNDSARKRRTQRAALREAAYELLGKAWPANRDTQEKYQDTLFSHCRTALPNSSRPLQLAILCAAERVLPRLATLATPMEAEPPVPAPPLAPLVDHVAAIVDYTLLNSNQVRHRKVALNLLEILAKSLIEMNKLQDYNQLRDIYQKYSQDLSKDSSHELRVKIESVKEYFK
ncbi:proteasome-associated protein ECM29 homolog [Aricia agestis]|uniref:proteasome-associated protein ECM29 homolog n=1 Tax=Aricia agestis TaxID=91739 RepID=UPI001C20B9BD|nr:proteasome-associated protein ECM29 homolog [Aricia agestis]